MGKVAAIALGVMVGAWTGSAAVAQQPAPGSTGRKPPVSGLMPVTAPPAGSQSASGLTGRPATSAASPASSAPPSPTSAAAKPAPDVRKPLSARDQKAIRDAELRDKRREERMLRVTDSICRGC